jgi:hypothetical protein
MLREATRQRRADGQRIEVIARMRANVARPDQPAAGVTSNDCD